MDTEIHTAAPDSMKTGLRPAGEEGIELSVLIPVHTPDEAASICELHAECTDAFSETSLRYEFVFVLEKEGSDVVEEVLRLKEESPASVKIIKLGRQYGSATALSVGVGHAAGEAVLTIPAFLQVEPDAIVSLISEVEDHDLILLKRSETGRGLFAKGADRLLRFPLRLVMGEGAYDLRQSVLLFRKEVVEAINIFGDKDRYLPILARRLGFKVKVAERGEAKRRDGRATNSSIRGGVSRILDLLSIFFLTEFTQKPLRFFGFFGLTSFSGGVLICIYLTVQRLFMGVPLADKPMLLLGILLIVLGVLLLSIGLIGEMVIFTNGKKESKNIIEKTVD